MKKYVKPELKCVELRVEERLATCFGGYWTGSKKEVGNCFYTDYPGGS